MATDTTTLLALPYLAAAQAQKHVTHNEALRLLDAIVQLSVKSDTVAAPPATLAEGDRYIVPTGATGAFAAAIGKVVAFQDGAWTTFQPQKGWLAYIEDRADLRVYSGSAWQSVAVAPSRLPLFGVNADADTTNRLSVSAAAILLNHEGAGHQMKVNKASAADTASLLFQTSFSGRAEMGLAGSDNFQIKVSANGASWNNALSIAASSGAATFVAAPSMPGLNGGPLAGMRNRIINGGFAVNQRGYASGTVLAAAAYGFDRWKAGTSGATLTFTAAAPETTVTITAGSLQQIIEAGNVEGGGYVLAWSGTAQGRVYQGSAPAYAASPVTVTGLTAGSAITVEFTGGSLTRVQLEPGSLATPFERRPIGTEIALCGRYFCTLALAAQSPSIGSTMVPFFFGRPMRATPTTSVLASGTATSATVSQVAVSDAGGGLFQINATAANGSVTGYRVGFSAEL